MLIFLPSKYRTHLYTNLSFLYSLLFGKERVGHVCVRVYVCVLGCVCVVCFFSKTLIKHI